jgi:hypothetical protein
VRGIADGNDMTTSGEGGEMVWILEEDDVGKSKDFVAIV